MKDTKIYDASMKAFPPSFDVEYYLEILFKQKEKEWFTPTNKNDDAYTICRELAMIGIIAERKIPQWSSGMFRGFHIEFLYVKDMEYGC